MSERLTIHRRHAKVGMWSHPVPASAFRRESIDGVDFAVTTKNFYLESASGKVRWTNEADTVHDVYIVRDGHAVFVFHLPNRETLADRVRIPMASDKRALLEHVREQFVPDGPFDVIVGAVPPAPAPETPSYFSLR